MGLQFIIMIAMGGACGAVCRYVAGYGLERLAFLPSHWPIGILFVNILGSLLLGFIAEVYLLKEPVSQAIKAFAVIGFLGGFTTFSAFSLDLVLMIERGALITALSYALISVMGGILALFLGLYAARLMGF